MVLENNVCAPVYVIRYWIDVLCSPMDLSPKRSGIDTIYGSGIIGFVILIAFTPAAPCADTLFHLSLCLERSKESAPYHKLATARIL